MKKTLLLFTLSISIFAQEKVYRIAYSKKGATQTLYFQASIEFTKKLFKKAGIKYEFVEVPGERALRLIQTGHVDTNLFRVLSVADNLVKENPKFSYFKYPFHDSAVILSTTPDIQNFKDFDEIKNSNIKIIALRGTQITKKLIKKDNTILINSQEQGPQMLLRNRGKYLLAGISKKKRSGAFFQKEFTAYLLGATELPKLELVQLLGERASIEILPKINKALKEMNNDTTKADKQAF